MGNWNWGKMIGIDYVSEITRPRMFCIEGGITIYPSVRTQDRPTDRPNLSSWNSYSEDNRRWKRAIPTERVAKFLLVIKACACVGTRKTRRTGHRTILMWRLKTKWKQVMITHEAKARARTESVESLMLDSVGFVVWYSAHPRGENEILVCQPNSPLALFHRHVLNALVSQNRERIKGAHRPLTSRLLQWHPLPRIVSIGNCETGYDESDGFEGHISRKTWKIYHLSHKERLFHSKTKPLDLTCG